MLRFRVRGPTGDERTVGGGEAVVDEVAAGYGDGSAAVGERGGRWVLRRVLRDWRRRPAETPPRRDTDGTDGAMRVATSSPGLLLVTRELAPPTSHLVASQGPQVRRVT